MRNELVDGGFVLRGQGRGGTVRRSLPVADSEPVITVSTSLPTSPAEVERTIQGELELYEPMRKVIAGEWAKDHRSDPVAVEITAMQGRRATGGTWSRPDITSVEVRTFSYVPGKFLEVVTFEVKPHNAINIQEVYEALAHRRTSTRAYVVLHVPINSATALTSSIADVAAVARGHGVGLVTAEDPADYETWDEREEAQRHEPDPERLDEFISAQLSDTAKKQISKQLH